MKYTEQRCHKRGSDDNEPSKVLDIKSECGFIVMKQSMFGMVTIHYPLL